VSGLASRAERQTTLANMQQRALDELFLFPGAENAIRG